MEWWNRGVLEISSLHYSNTPCPTRVSRPPFTITFLVSRLSNHRTTSSTAPALSLRALLPIPWAHTCAGRTQSIRNSLPDVCPPPGPLADRDIDTPRLDRSSRNSDTPSNRRHTRTFPIVRVSPPIGIPGRTSSNVASCANSIAGRLKSKLLAAILIMAASERAG